MPHSSDELPEGVPSSATLDSPEIETVDRHTQWVDFSLENHDYCQKSTQFKDGECQSNIVIAEEETLTAQLIKTDTDAKLYAGIHHQTFLTLVQCMTVFAQTKRRMPVEDHVLMTLMKLKLNLLAADLSRRYGVSDSLVSKTVKFWIDTLAIHLNNLIVWLPREIIKATMPSCFERYPNTTCVLDCAETIMQKASNLKSRGESYSNYKSHNTVKY